MEYFHSCTWKLHKLAFLNTHYWHVIAKFIDQNFVLYFSKFVYIYMCSIVLLAMCFRGLILLKTTLILCNIFKLLVLPITTDWRGVVVESTGSLSLKSDLRRSQETKDYLVCWLLSLTVSAKPIGSSHTKVMSVVCLSCEPYPTPDPLPWHPKVRTN